MPELSDYRKAGVALYEKLHLATYPVAIKYLRDESEIPPKTVRPSQSGQKWCLCQAITYARRWGWTAAMTADDNFCTPATASHRWVEVSADDLLQSQLFQAWHKDVEAEKKRQKHGLDQVGEVNLSRLSQYCGFISSPLAHAPLIPDSVLVFGNGENINHIIQALTYDGENGGLVPFITGIPQIVLPGMGDRTFSGVYDYEIGIGLPAGLLFSAVENLFKSGGRLNLGNPVRTLLPTGITESITPGFKYMREKIDEHQKR
jgi:uncharacterized protein (DUF169 family)